MESLHYQQILIQYCFLRSSTAWRPQAGGPGTGEQVLCRPSAAVEACFQHAHRSDGTLGSLSLKSWARLAKGIWVSESQENSVSAESVVSLKHEIPKPSRSRTVRGHSASGTIKCGWEYKSMEFGASHFRGGSVLISDSGNCSPEFMASSANSQPCQIPTGLGRRAFPGGSCKHRAWLQASGQIFTWSMQAQRLRSFCCCSCRRWVSSV